MTPEQIARWFHESPNRLWSRVDRGPECWVWTGPRRRGYGLITLGGTTRSVHRVVWTMTHGEIPDGLEVLHRCDNPPCVRPDHLRLGTHRENMHDMIVKHRGRWRPRRGEQHPRVKLTDKECAALVSARERGETFPALAGRFGISKAQAWRIANGTSRARRDARTTLDEGQFVP